jgi:hypothetical protein
MQSTDMPAVDSVFVTTKIKGQLSVKNSEVSNSYKL